MRCGHVAGGEVIDMDLKLEAALDTRDALAKSIYAALFRCSLLTPVVHGMPQSPH